MLHGKHSRWTCFKSEHFRDGNTNRPGFLSNGVFTLEGFLGDPSYGGNKDYVGWKLVGFGTTPPGAGYDGTQMLHQHHHGAKSTGG